MFTIWKIHSQTNRMLMYLKKKIVLRSLSQIMFLSILLVIFIYSDIDILVIVYLLCHEDFTCAALQTLHTSCFFPYEIEQGCFYLLFIFNVRVSIMVFNATFNNISVISWRSVLLVGGKWSTRRKPSTCRKSMTHFIT